MSPPSRDLNGPRPGRLKIHKDSHHIQKPSSSTSSSSSSSSSTTGGHHHQPVIIYTHSPKVIHTQACDFMALVQKLTGLSHSEDDEFAVTHPSPPPVVHHDVQCNEKNIGYMPNGHDDSSSSSSENCIVGCSLFTSASVSSPAFHHSPVSPLDFPCFIPADSDACCATAFPPPITSIDDYFVPSVMDAMKPFLNC